MNQWAEYFKRYNECLVENHYSLKLEKEAESISLETNESRKQLSNLIMTQVYQFYRSTFESKKDSVFIHRVGNVIEASDAFKVGGYNHDPDSMAVAEIWASVKHCDASTDLEPFIHPAQYHPIASSKLINDIVASKGILTELTEDPLETISQFIENNFEPTLPNQKVKYADKSFDHVFIKPLMIASSRLAVVKKINVSEGMSSIDVAHIVNLWGQVEYGLFIHGSPYRLPKQMVINFECCFQKWQMVMGKSTESIDVAKDIRSLLPFLLGPTFSNVWMDIPKFEVESFVSITLKVIRTLTTCKLSNVHFLFTILDALFNKSPDPCVLGSEHLLKELGDSLNECNQTYRKYSGRRPYPCPVDMFASFVFDSRAKLSGINNFGLGLYKLLAEGPDYWTTKDEPLSPAKIYNWNQLALKTAKMAREDGQIEMAGSIFLLLLLRNFRDFRNLEPWGDILGEARVIGELGSTSLSSAISYACQKVSESGCEQDIAPFILARYASVAGQNQRDESVQDLETKLIVQFKDLQKKAERIRPVSRCEAQHIMIERLGPVFNKLDSITQGHLVDSEYLYATFIHRAKEHDENLAHWNSVVSLPFQALEHEMGIGWKKVHKVGMPPELGTMFFAINFVINKKLPKSSKEEEAKDRGERLLDFYPKLAKCEGLIKEMKKMTLKYRNPGSHGVPISYEKLENSRVDLYQKGILKNFFEKLFE